MSRRARLSVMRLKLLALLLIAAIPADIFSQEPQVVNLSEQKTVSFDSDNFDNWYIRSGKLNLSAYKPNAFAESFRLDNEKSPWIKTKIPGILVEPAGPLSREVNEVWHLKTFELNNPQKTLLAIELGYIDDVDRVYLNGVLIGSTGKNWQSSEPQAYDKTRLYAIPPEALNNSGLNILLVHARKYFPHEIGIIRGSTAIGPMLPMFKEYERNAYTSLFFLVVYLTVAGYFLFLFIRRPQEKANFFFAAFTTGLVFYNALRNPLKYDLSFFNFLIFKKAEYMLLFLLIPAIYYFIRFYFEIPRNRFTLWLDRIQLALSAIMIVLAVIVLFTSSAVLWDKMMTGFVQLYLWPFFLFGMMGIMIYRITRKDKDAMVLIGGIVAVILAAIIDILINMSILNLPRVTGFVFFAVILTMATVLANRFVRLHSQVEDLNRNLEKKVEDRTRELQDTLEKVQQLKEQQDGDYFLTSLLIEPLAVTSPESENFSFDFYVRQKKKFQFRHWQREIGGDLNLAQSISLRNRPFTIFINADAMGKSIQGAGGALVLGSVFSSVIERSKLSANVQANLPEQWLKNMLFEFSHIFESFNGSMLMSMFVGLIDEQNGLLYYLNSEHPFPVLYRDGTADFLSTQMAIRKLGIPEQFDKITISTFQLQPGDIIVAGSDGRDDISLGMKDGERIINEDENLFTRIVAQTKADLKEIVSALENEGELTDDLSLIRIECQSLSNSTSAENVTRVAELLSNAQSGTNDNNFELVSEYLLDRNPLNTEHRVASLELAKELKEKKRFFLAAQVLEKHITWFPFSDNEFHATAYSYKMARQYTKAIQISEALLIRNPEHVKNLINLTDCLIKTNNFKRAAIITERGLIIDPENEKLNLLQKKLHDLKEPNV